MSLIGRSAAALVGLLLIGVLPAPATAAAALKATTLSSATPAYDLGGECATIATLTVRVLDPDGETSAARASSTVSPTGVTEGNARVASFTLLGRSGRYVSYRARAIFCGIGNSRGVEADAPGGYRWSFRFATAGPDITGSRSMFVRILGHLSFNASPEPVAPNGKVKLTAYLWDGWEESYPGVITFFFKADGSSTYVRVAREKTVCGGEGAEYQCVVRSYFPQSRSGTWRAASAPTRWYSAARQDDHVAVA